MNNYVGDTELQRVLQRRYFQLDPRGRPSLDEVHQRIVRVLSLVENLVPTRDAIMALANAGWNDALAVQHINRTRRPSSSAAVTSTQTPTEVQPADTPHKEKSTVPKGKGQIPNSTIINFVIDHDIGKDGVPKDNDDDLPLPKDVEPIDVDDPDRPGAISQYAHSVLQSMIH